MVHIYRWLGGALMVSAAVLVYFEAGHIAPKAHQRKKVQGAARRDAEAVAVPAEPGRPPADAVGARVTRAAVAATPRRLPPPQLPPPPPPPPARCKLTLAFDPRDAVKASRNVDLSVFRVDGESFGCALLSPATATAQAAVRVTFNISERPPRREPDGMDLIAGFILLAVAPGESAFGRSTVAGRVVMAEGESASAQARVYAASVDLVHVDAPWTLHLYYRHEDVHYWERDASLKVGDVVRLKENKVQKDAWLTKIPQRVRQILHPHYTPMFTRQPEVRVAIPGQGATPDGALPWCDQVDAISPVGRVRGELVKLGFRRGDGWVPSNCRMRAYWNSSRDDPMWRALPSNIRMRVIGDSNFGHIADDGYGALPRSPAVVKGQFPKVPHRTPSGATAMYRYFRGMDCTDHLTSILFKQVPASRQRYQHRRDLLVMDAVTNNEANRPCPVKTGDPCLNFVYDAGEPQGPDLTDTSVHHVIVLNAGAWLITYKSLAFSKNFADGLREVLRHCAEHHADLRARTTILWTETFAANESSADKDEGNGWRSLWNTRVLEHEDNVRRAIEGLVDAIVPTNTVTASIEDHIWDDPFQMNRVHQRRRTYNHLTDVILNYVAWAGARKAAESQGARDGG